MSSKDFNVDQAYEILWKEHYKKLVAYKRKYGDFKVHKNELKDLYRWIAKQREFKKLGLLSASRRKMLDKIGFPWSAQQEKWDNNIKALIDYKKKFKKFAICYDKKYSKLRRWVDWIRKNEHRLTSSRWQDIKRTGFPFRADLALQKRNRWEKMYEQLNAHFKKHGHLRLIRSKKNTSLIHWIVIQRKNKKKLTSQQREKLNRLNFVWDIRQETNKVWNEKFKELQKFHSNHGHTRVSYEKKEIKLRKWMDIQRRHRSTLEPEQLKKLKSVDFEWTVNGRIYMDKQWDKQYASLVNFYNKHGHFNVPPGYQENPSLPSWIYQIKNGKINSTGRRGEKLKKINFKW